MLQANERNPESIPLEKRFYIVGIGASVGGLEAFVEQLRALPLDSGLAVVVVQHLEPNYESQLTEILSRVTPTPVVQAEEDMQVERNHVDVIPPNTVMIIRVGALHLGPRSQSTKPHYPIDAYFESLAADQGSQRSGRSCFPAGHRMERRVRRKAGRACAVVSSRNGADHQRSPRGGGAVKTIAQR